MVWCLFWRNVWRLEFLLNPASDKINLFEPVPVEIVHRSRLLTSKVLTAYLTV